MAQSSGCLVKARGVTSALQRFIAAGAQPSAHIRHGAPLSRSCLYRHQARFPCRQFSSSTGRQLTASLPRPKARTTEQPFSLYSGIFFVLCGGGMLYYFQSEKDRVARKKIRDASKGVGKPRIGGDFVLVDQDGKQFTSEQLKGKFALVYFGFSNCPDICPDELDKMAKMIDTIKAKRGNVLLPIFITCDPARDSPQVLKDYLAEFHTDIIGLTGSWEDIKSVCKAYRVYFSTPPHVKPGEDYLVDHSIYFYLMGKLRWRQRLTIDPENDFVEVVGRQHTASSGAKLVSDHIGDWDGPIDKR